MGISTRRRRSPPRRAGSIPAIRAGPRSRPGSWETRAGRSKPPAIRRARRWRTRRDWRSRRATPRWPRRATESRRERRQDAPLRRGAAPVHPGTRRVRRRSTRHRACGLRRHSRGEPRRLGGPHHAVARRARHHHPHPGSAAARRSAGARGPPRRRGGDARPRARSRPAHPGLAAAEAELETGASRCTHRRRRRPRGRRRRPRRSRRSRSASSPGSTGAAWPPSRRVAPTRRCATGSWCGRSAPATSGSTSTSSAST